jgi:hypothetical protein
VDHSYNPSTGEAGRENQVQGQLGLHRETLPQEIKIVGQGYSSAVERLPTIYNAKRKKKKNSV